MKTQVSTKGKIPFLLIYIGVIAFLVFAFAFRTTNRHGGELIENFIVSLGGLSPLILPALLLPSFWILKKKVPFEISIESDYITLGYSKTHIKKISKTKMAYSVHHHKFHSVIVFYSKLRATRGHLLYNSITDIVATNIPFSWNPNALRNIETELLKKGFERREIEDNKIFILRIIG